MIARVDLSRRVDFLFKTLELTAFRGTDGLLSLWQGRRTTAALLSSEPDKFSVVLIDPKEYFEDVTAQPRSMVACGEEYNGPGDQGSTWAKTVCMYKDFVVKNGELVNGQLEEAGG